MATSTTLSGVFPLGSRLNEQFAGHGVQGHFTRRDAAINFERHFQNIGMFLQFFRPARSPSCQLSFLA